jgi:hypothetical protein
MNERSYLYQLIRYVPDLRRMEPQNIGVIVQGDPGVTYRLWSHFRPLGDKPDFDYANFRKWREFFEAEINGPQIKMFQPRRDRPEFLEYLQSRCRGNYIVTQALNVAMQTENIEDVKNFLYETLVRSPQDEPHPAEQPVRRFREQLQVRKLDKSPFLHRDEYVVLPGGDSELFHWQYEKNHGSNMKVLIEPVQWLDKIRITQLELEHVLSAAKKVRDANLHAELIVVMDEVATPSKLAKDATKRLYENYLKGKEDLAQLSDKVISEVSQSEELVSRIESDLRERSIQL